MRKIQKTDSEIVNFENNQNQILEMFISMKFGAECKKTTPAISFPRFHEDSEIVTKMTSKKSLEHPKSSSLKRNKNRYGISTFETLETAMILSVLIIWTSEHRRNVTWGRR